MKYAIPILVFFSLTSQLTAQNCPCCSAAYRTFDFWIGNWNVYNAQEELVGHNAIYLLQDSCVIQENWSSVKSDFTGTSYNFYDAQKEQWHQVWLDNKGGSLDLSGGFFEGKMVLKSTIEKDKKGITFYHQITWEPLKDGSVRQLWQTFLPDGTQKAILFDGYYRKIKN